MIRDTLRSETGLLIPDHTLRYYDPWRAGSKLSPKLKAYGDEVRKAYVERATDVAIAHQAHRLRKLEAIIEGATKSKDYGNAIKGLELAAKEMGGTLAGQHTVTHKGAVAHVHGSIDDMRSELAMRLTTLADAMALPAPATAEGETLEGEVVPGAGTDADPVAT
jgi:hypothetical protein